MRATSIKDLYKKKFKTIPMGGEWGEVFGQPEPAGAWIIWGAEKNGKTWFALMLANYLSTFAKVWYVSAEEGMGKSFVENCKRAGISAEITNLKFMEYIPLADLLTKLSKQRSADIIILDNVTIYNDELKNGVIRNILQKYGNKLFVFVAHEDRNEPYTASAKLIKKLAKVVVYVEGLACLVSGRVPGGMLMIDEKKATLYHGSSFSENLDEKHLNEV